MIRCVISDLGKVLLFFDNNIFFRKMANYSPFSLKEIAALTSAHFNLVEYFDKGKMTPQEFYRQVTKTFKAKIDYDTFYSFYSDVFSPNLPVLEVMKRLKKNYKILILSNTDVVRFAFIKKKFPEILIFNGYILSYEVGLMKPDPRIYREALKMAGADARECVFIDDIKENVEAALRLGIHGIQMEPETNLEAALLGMGLSF
jgi:putative hydrolase of the HAD superfamily